MTKTDKMYKKDVKIDCNSKEYMDIMNIYNLALNKVNRIMLELKEKLNYYSGYDFIYSVTSRIKSYNSIINKMEKKKIKYNHDDLIKNINDIAGIRITCMTEEDTYKMIEIISSIDDINIIKEKDYIKRPKKSGYSAYHIIVEVPVFVKEQKVWVKVEIQIRTIGMDFWSSLEHKVNYKPNKKISKRNQNKLKLYAKIILKINTEMSKMFKKNYKYVEN